MVVPPCTRPEKHEIEGTTFSAAVNCDFYHRVVVGDGPPKTVEAIKNYKLCAIPYMIGCRCRRDNMGSFIINGNKKVVLSQLTMAPNRVFAFRDRSDQISVCCRSKHIGKWRSTSTLALERCGGGLGFRVPFVYKKKTTKSCIIPVPVILAMVGATKAHVLSVARTAPAPNIVRDIEQMAEITMDPVAWFIAHAAGVTTTKGARGVIRYSVDNEILPHTTNKTHVIVLMLIKMLATEAGVMKPDDRDSFVCKRLCPAGVMIARVVRAAYRRTFANSMRTISRRLDRGDTVALKTQFNQHKLTTAITYHFATGNWSIRSGVGCGVCQNLVDTNEMARIAQVNRINTPVNRVGRCGALRMVHSSSFGLLCPADTPEGQGCGLVLSPTTGLHVMHYDTPTERWIGPLALVLSRLIATHEITTHPPVDVEHTHVAINGHVALWVATDSHRVASHLRAARDTGEIHPFTSITIDIGVVWLYCGVGCMARPLVPVSKAESLVELMTASDATGRWNEACARGYIVFRQKVEEACLSIAMKSSRKTAADEYIEISELAVFSASAMAQPYANFNQGPRLAYQCNMGRQALLCGVRTAATRTRMCLAHSQRPLVSTAIDDIVSSQCTTGFQAVVVIMAWDGSNVEDGIIVNKSSCERGMGMVVHEHVLRSKPSLYDRSHHANPTMVSRCKLSYRNYDALDNRGIPVVGRRVRKGDVVIGKVVFPKKGIPIDVSVCYDKSDMGRISSVRMIGGKGVKMNTVVVTINHLRYLSQGDKLASRHAQKGIVARLVDSVNLPFSASTGVSADIIINPHAIPSRMTIGQMLESITGKASCCDGKLRPGTPFSDPSLDESRAVLKAYGLSPSGTECYRDPHTGRLIASEAYTGLVYMQRLKHFVQGPVVLLARCAMILFHTHHYHPPTPQIRSIVARRVPRASPHTSHWRVVHVVVA